MTVRRLRDLNLALYDHPYDHTRWADHLVERVAHTAGVVGRFARETYAHRAADLTCGDAAVLNRCGHEFDSVLLGDLVPGPWQTSELAVTGTTVVGPIAETVQRMGEVDLFVCSETLEHVEDPTWLLSQIRRHAAHLVLTTPEACWGDDNLEHLWAWDQQGISDLLSEAGFGVRAVESFSPEAPSPYVFQIWCAS